ncbi:MAG: HmuY family protein [Flavobacterium sp.]
MKKQLIFALSVAALAFTACSDDDNTQAYVPPVATAALQPATGGPTQANSVFVDLSNSGMASVQRTSWDLGFYSGDEFRVLLNGSLKMSAKQLETTNIDAVVQPDETMFIAQGQGFANQVDGPDGIITGTAIAAVSANDADNKVYLINLGNGPAATAPAVGAEASASGPHRGWKKVRVLRNGTGYKVQYADINATTHQEVTIAKNAAFNFTGFSFTTNSIVDAEPVKAGWDLTFTTFTNTIPSPPGSSTLVPYYYPDYIVTNTKGGARSYQVMIAGDITYDSFDLADVDQSKFTNDQRNIGSNWRGTSVIGPGGFPISQFVLRTDRFYVVKDTDNNVYKIRMTGGANEAGERGFPAFQYQILQ